MNTLLKKILAFKEVNDNQYNQLFTKKEVSDFKDALGMEPFIDRILQAQLKQEKVFVGGDYDADGMCATAIMVDTLNTLDIQCGYYIPNRITEGYGLHVNTVEKVFEKNYQLLITVDNGVKSNEAIAHAKQLGMDIMVSDHHAYDEAPDCIMVHAFTMGERYKYLSGAGVALAIARRLGVFKKEHVVLTGIALLADMMPVWEENRPIIQHTIEYLNLGVLPSVQRFKSSYEHWNETMISYAIVPKLNAVGRMPELMDVNKIIPFLLSEDKTLIDLYYTKLNAINEIRKQKSQEMIETASLLIEDYKFPVIHCTSFHEGIVGIVAGKIVNEQNRPVAVLSKKGNLLKGSARSIPGLSLVDFFDDFKHHFLQFGGHDGAVGILMEEAKLPLLYQFINEKEIPKPVEVSALEIELADLTIENVKALQVIRPFGVGFSIPTFEMKNVAVLQQVKFGNKPHYKLVINEDIEILYFNQKTFENKEIRTIKFNQISIKKEKQKEKISIIAIS